ncbi:CvpA family protein [Priestia taiwanensis]|uniref:Membrane protein n=1 Tax=Priestia taiwanensis TaxID=1347902 RepID=A0A917AUB6_9BACI|nr:CvpA family protein [Priestia taiwanensis]MBM7363506.1 putative membrane protein required for colicin V production [Priestia taiwanensis]GGE76545.1 membrane protein [Priestia taiwanensis]
MLDFIILALLFVGFLRGIKRGFVMQTIRLLSSIAAFIVAYIYAGDLGAKLHLWIPFPAIGDQSFLTEFLRDVSVETAYYYVIAFFIIFIGTKIVLFIVGSMLDFVASIPVLKQINSIAGGALGLVETYLLLFVLLIIGSKLPIESIQHSMQNSYLSEIIVEQTPILSKSIKNLWA